MNEPDPLLGRTIRRGTIELQELIGDGGMGRVYKGVDTRLSRKVAVKILRPEHQSLETARVYFEREARAASKLWHPNIIQIIDFGVDDDGTLFLVMEYVPGKNLADIIEENFPLPPQRIVRILTQVLTALEAAHSHGIVHRDLKPENIMLQDVPGNPDFVKVLDFGVAKAVEMDAAGPMTIQGLVMGTPHFMSPEQALGQDIDPRSDLYSIGAILYQVMTAQLPFDGRLVMNVLSKVITEKPVPPSQRVVGIEIDPALEAICMRALRKNAEGRFQDAAEFREALLRSLETRPREAVPPRKPLSTELSADDLEPFRKRTRSVFTDSVFDFASVAKELDVSGETRELAVMAAQFRTQIAPDSSRFGRDNSEFETLFDQAVHRFGGISASHIGATSTAVFGYPRAVRDGVRLAALAADAVLSSLAKREDAEVGLGIAHGKVVIPEDELAAAYGEPLEQALHLASSAQDGQVLADRSVTEVETMLELTSSPDSNIYHPIIAESRQRQTAPIEVSLPLLGRKRLTERFRHVVDCALEGRPVALAITGSEGSGKSRMLSMVIRDAEQQRVAMLEATAERYNGFLPGLPLARLVSAALELVPANSRGEAMSELGLNTDETRILRALLRGAPPPEAAKHWVDAASTVVTRLLRQVSRRVPLLLLIDNFESVDMLTFSTVLQLTERLDGERIAIVVAGDDDHPLVQAFAETHHEIKLPALPLETVTRYLSNAFPELNIELLQRVARMSEGSPRKLVLMVEFLRLRLPRDTDALPETPLTILADRLEGLSESARKLLAIAGALGPAFPLDALAGACPRSWDLRDNLRAIGEAGILSLREDDSRIWLSFDVPILARMAVKQLSDETRRQIHLRVARYFEQEREENPSPDTDVQWARQLGYAGQGADAVEPYMLATHTALAWYGGEVTLQMVDALLNTAYKALPPDSELLHDAILLAATVMVKAHHNDDAIDLLDRLGQVATDPVMKAEQEILRAEAMLELNRESEARHAIRRALSLSEDHPLLLARSHTLMGILLESRNQDQAALSEIEAAASLLAHNTSAIPRIHRDAAWQPFLIAGRIQLRANRFPAAVRALQRAQQEAMNHKDSAGLVVISHTLAATYRSWDGMQSDARRAYAEAHSAAVRAGAVADQVRICRDFGTLLVEEEDYTSAHRYFSEALHLAEDYGAREIMLEAQTWLDRIRGNIDRTETNPSRDGGDDDLT